MSVVEGLYDLGMRAGSALLPRTPFLPSKLRDGLEGRQGLHERIEGWASTLGGGEQVVWFHAPSVGEGLQTAPVITALRELRPDLKIFYTFFSPSARDIEERLDVDYADFMPFDVASDVAAVIDLLKPAAIVFGKADVWPNITRAAEERGVPLALVSATLASGSSRLSWPARTFLSRAYARLAAVGAISEGDAERLKRLSVAGERVSVTGDARFDQVSERAAAIDTGAPPLSLLKDHDGPTIVAGSTWPEGERYLVPALARLRAKHPRLRAIVAPHEPSEGHLSWLEKRLADAGLTAERLSRLVDVDAGRQCVLVDRVGILAELYAVADVAYVGGGFGHLGLHSVLEPAVLGVPVIYGPRHANAVEATHLIERGAGIVASGLEALEGGLARWLEDGEARAKAGAAAAGYVRENLGAGRRNAELVVELLG